MKRLPFLMALLFVFAFTIVAQTTGTLNGTISDQGGALVPGATVTLTNTATGASRSTTTNSSVLLGSGVVPITAVVTGFKTLVFPIESRFTVCNEPFVPV